MKTVANPTRLEPQHLGPDLRDDRDEHDHRDEDGDGRRERPRRDSRPPGTARAGPATGPRGRRRGPAGTAGPAPIAGVDAPVSELTSTPDLPGAPGAPVLWVQLTEALRFPPRRRRYGSMGAVTEHPQPIFSPLADRRPRDRAARLRRRLGPAAAALRAGAHGRSGRAGAAPARPAGHGRPRRPDRGRAGGAAAHLVPGVAARPAGLAGRRRRRRAGRRAPRRPARGRAGPARVDPRRPPRPWPRTPTARTCGSLVAVLRDGESTCLLRQREHDSDDRVAIGPRHRPRARARAQRHPAGLSPLATPRPRRCTGAACRPGAAAMASTAERASANVDDLDHAAARRGRDPPPRRSWRPARGTTGRRRHARRTASAGCRRSARPCRRWSMVPVPAICVPPVSAPGVSLSKMAEGEHHPRGRPPDVPGVDRHLDREGELRAAAARRAPCARPPRRSWPSHRGGFRPGAAVIATVSPAACFCTAVRTASVLSAGTPSTLDDLVAGLQHTLGR